MPTIFTHALLPLIAAAGLPMKVPGRLVLAGMAVAMLPDADVIGGIVFGVPHTHDFGHRGASHTLFFAALVGLTGLLFAHRMHAPSSRVFAFLTMSTLSHPLTDMMTDGGKGIMMLWPLEESRYKLLFHPVEVSPVGLRAFETGRIWAVLLSETLWLLIPAALLAFFARLAVKSSR